MKYRILCALAAAALVAGLLTGCGGGTSSSSQAQVPPAQSASQPASQSGPGSGVPAEDLNAMLAALVEGAELGTTIDVIELDLKAGGVDVANISAWAGAQSQMVGQNGGIALIIKAQPGQAETVAAQLRDYQQASMGNEDYADFEAARTNTSNARIATSGDFVVYAVSATGTDAGWQKLDDAIAALFA